MPPTRRNIDLYQALGLDDKARKQRAKRIAAALWSRWRGLTRGLPGRYKSSYQSAMRLSVRGSHVELSLEGDTLSGSVEYGYGPGGIGTQGPYDMRKTLLRSNSAKSGPKGRYLSVPMGMTTRKLRGMKGGSRAYRMARQLASSVVSAGGNTKWGGALPRGLVPKLRAQGRTVPGIGFQPPHATDPAHGLRRVKRGGGSSRYGTFRTISEGGKPWVHPGIKARRFIRRVSGMVRSVVREVG